MVTCSPIWCSIVRQARDSLTKWRHDIINDHMSLWENISSMQKTSNMVVLLSQTMIRTTLTRLYLVKRLISCYIGNGAQQVSKARSYVKSKAMLEPNGNIFTEVPTHYHHHFKDDQNQFNWDVFTKAAHKLVYKKWRPTWVKTHEFLIKSNEKSKALPDRYPCRVVSTLSTLLQGIEQLIARPFAIFVSEDINIPCRIFSIVPALRTRNVKL